MPTPSDTPVVRRHTLCVCLQAAPLVLFFAIVAVHGVLLGLWYSFLRMLHTQTLRLHLYFP